MVRNGIRLEILPVQSTVLLSAFGNKATRIRKRALLSFQINEDEFENIFRVCPQLISDIILVSDFLFSYEFAMDLEK
jgi:hypothetical protein